MIGDPNLRLLKLEFDAVYFFEVICGDLKTHGCLDQGSTGLLWNFFSGRCVFGIANIHGLNHMTCVELGSVVDSRARDENKSG